LFSLSLCDSKQLSRHGNRCVWRRIVEEEKENLGQLDRMGNENSLPEDPDFDEQARAPPSSTNPPQQQHHQHHHHSQPHATITSTSVAKGKKVMGAMFHGKEASRAAAMGGNYYDESADYANNGSTEYSSTAQHMPQQQQQQQQQPQDPYDPTNPQQQQQHVVVTESASSSSIAVGVMFEKGKRGFPGRASARGAALINSMRNITLGGTLRSKKAEVNDWEKQWDEDDDSDEEEPPTDAPLHQVRPGGMDTGHSSVPYATTQEVHRVTPTPPDLLSTPIPSRDDSYDDGYSVSSAQAPQLDAEEKPDVHMFLPMLRVLGKGSFGKVRLVLLSWTDVLCTVRTCTSNNGSLIVILCTL
jgi:hypothetical protein